MDSLDLAKKMLERAGMDAGTINSLFCPPGVASRPIGGQPALDGDHGKMLSAARVLRPLVPGHVAAVEFVAALDDMVIRASGRFVDATLLMKSVGKEFGDFWNHAGNKAFFEALVEKRRVDWSCLIILDGAKDIFRYSGISQNTPKDMDFDLDVGNGVWVDYALGVKMAIWANKRFEVEVCDLVTRYMRGQLSITEIDATQALLTQFTEPIDDASVDEAERAPLSAKSSSALSARERGIVWGVDVPSSEYFARLSAEDIVMVFGHPYLRVITPTRDACIPPGFGHRQVFYILFRGFSVRTGLPLWELGCTNDLDRRLPEHARAPFPTARIAILIATTACAGKDIEDPAKKSIFADLLTKIDTKTEVFNASKDDMVQRVKELYGTCAHVIASTFVDHELGLGPCVDGPLVAMSSHASHATESVHATASPVAKRGEHERAAQGAYEMTDDNVEVSVNNMEIERSRREDLHLDRLEVTKRLYFVEDTKRLAEETKREVEREITKRETERRLFDLKNSMVLNGYSIMDIERLCCDQTR